MVIYNDMNTYNKHRQEVVEKALLMIARENKWQVKEIITNSGYHRTIYKIPAHHEQK
jgi:hypothetical protein